MDVQLLPIALDSLDDLAQDVDRLGIRSPYLRDEGGRVAKAYQVTLTHGGEPGHWFILVGKDGRILWIKDYSQKTMYVPVDELYQEISRRLG